MGNVNNRGNKCGCEECAEHGQRVRLIAGINHQIVVREDGTATADETFSGTPRRGPVRFRQTPDGQIVPVDRGERRSKDLQTFGPIIDAVGPNRPELPGAIRGVAASQRRGRRPGRQLDPGEARRRVARYRELGQTLEAAWKAVGDDLGWSAETVRKAYFRKAD
jgi:hypothetical protein